MKKLLTYFLHGLLVLLPLGATLYVIIFSVIKVNDTLDFNFPGIGHIPGLGILIVLLGITILGFLSSGILGTGIMKVVDYVASKTPLVKIIYTSIRDLANAFLGEKKTFTKPVLVDLLGNGVQHIGFITRENLGNLGIENKVAVYFPTAYSLAGNVAIVPLEKIQAFEGNYTDAMRFVVSGGVTGLTE